MRVALAGATGNLGPAILKQLIGAGFKVTVLTRQISSGKDFPTSVSAIPVDYDSLDSLTEALTGHDAVISTMASAALAKQLLLVKAAVKAGVQRFIPSEFGSNTVIEKTSKLPAYRDKVAVQEALKKEAAAGRMTWTAIINGPFLDWGIMVGFLVNLKDKSINLYDGGDNRYSTTTHATISKAVVGVLTHLKETENRVVYVQDTILSQKKLAAMAKKATGDEDSWKEPAVSTEELVAQGWEEVKSPNPDPHKFVMKFISAAIWGQGYGAQFDKLDNDLLGIKEMSDNEVQELINSLVP